MRVSLSTADGLLLVRVRPRTGTLRSSPPQIRTVKSAAFRSDACGINDPCNTSSRDGTAAKETRPYKTMNHS